MQHICLPAQNPPGHKIIPYKILPVENPPGHETHKIIPGHLPPGTKSCHNNKRPKSSRYICLPVQALSLTLSLSLTDIHIINRIIIMLSRDSQRHSSSPEEHQKVISYALTRLKKFIPRPQGKSVIK